MTDLASLVLGIPSYVEGFVKLARVVKKLESLERDHVEAIEDAMFCAENLEYYAGFLDIKKPEVLQHPSHPLLEAALVHAYDALDTAKNTLNEWKHRLQPLPGKSQCTPKINKWRVFLAQKIMRMTPIESEPLVSPSHAGSKLLAKAAYLAFGVVEIKDAMARLNKWLSRLATLLLTSPSLRLQNVRSQGKEREFMAENVAFVARARRRVAEQREVPIIDLHHLESIFDIDPEHNSRIFRLESGDYAGYIVDSRDPFLEHSKRSFESEVKDTIRICQLAAEMPSDLERGARANVGILPCAGYAIRSSPPTHLLLFHLPAGIGAPCTLRGLLLAGRAQHTLNSRLEFCIKLVTSVLILHSLGLVHKNIRPDSVLVANDLRSDSSEGEVGTPFLLAFGQARLVEGTSSQQPYDGDIYYRNLYIHPRHLGGKRMKWLMRDDIYSLGICLFEIAIWRSLLVWDSQKGGLVGDFDFLPLSDEHYDAILKDRGKSIYADRIWMRRNDIIKYASQMIAATMGQTFRNIVVDCLHFGDSKIVTEEDEGTEEDDQTNVQDKSKDPDSDKAILFVEDILAKLQNLVFAF